MTTLRIVHLYPAELGLNGDRGNVLVLRRRLEWRGLAVETVDVAPGEPLPGTADLVHVGSGARSARDAVLPAARAHGALLQEWATAGVPMIAVGAGMHLFAQQIVDLEGRARAGLGLLPITVRDARSRAVGEALGVPRADGRLAGFVNHGVTVELHDADPLTVLDRGPGNSGSTAAADRGEGVRAGVLIGTHLGGPVLPMNPGLADELLAAALARRSIDLPAADAQVAHADTLARHARAAIAARLGRAGVAV
ncbi:hypothetical protein [Microcella sp.]|uniref:hypothetical protein n=1 Tax=Microcella sp. TaxID=1913979 RepID=UPI00391ACA60